MKHFPPRRHPRVEFHQLPWVFSMRLPEPAPAEQPIRLEARNISLGGMKFLCNRRFSVFETLQVSFIEKKDSKILATVQGKVVRVEEIDTGYGERTYGIALEFTTGTEDLSAHLPGSPTNASPK